MALLVFFMAFKQGVRVTRSFILDRIREEDIFNKYFGPVIFDRDVRNYARPDKHPGCRFYVHKVNGRIRFKDHSRGYNWDCFEAAVQQVGPTYRLEFRSLLTYIAKDFGLITSNTSNRRILEIRKQFVDNIDEANNVIKKGIKIEGLRTKLGWMPRKYWNQYGITELITKRFYTYEYDRASIVRFYSDGSTTEKALLTSYSELKFAYYLGEGEWKLYFPERPKEQTRFIQTRADIIQGWYLLPTTGRNLVITKAYKDVMSFWSLGEIPAIAPQSENILIDKKIMAVLRERFDNIYILFDNDLAGLRASVKYVDKYDYIKPITLAGDYKDLSDSIKAFGIERVRNTLLPIFG